MNIDSSNKAWEVKYRSSTRAYFLWSAIFVALAVWMFLSDINMQEERSLRFPISVKADFDSAYCGRATGPKARGFALFVKYNYQASTKGGGLQKYKATESFRMADRELCETYLLTAAKKYPFQYFYYEADAPQKYRLSIEKQSSLYILFFGLLLAAVLAAFGFSQLEDQRTKKRKD
jgi:hypothetical protein